MKNYRSPVLGKKMLFQGGLGIFCRTGERRWPGLTITSFPRKRSGHRASWFT